MIRLMSRSSLVLAIGALTLSGCVGAVSDLDFDFRGNAISNAGATQTAPRPAPDANGLITYPNYQLAVARNGDTIASVASRLGLQPAELARFNGRSEGDVLRAGEVLALPRRVTPTGGAGRDITSIASSAIDAAEARNPSAAPVVQTGAEPIRHRVNRGETAYSIARLYNVPVRSLADWNGLGPDLEVREGQQLIIPVTTGGGARGVDGAAPGASVPPPPPSSSTALPAPIATATLPSATPAPAPAPTAAPAPATPAPAADAGGQLLRPVAGDILRPFSGSNEGIDIAAVTGTPVRAADAGEVAAITRDTDQVPILVLRHEGGLLTVYANIRNITVERGDRVTRGQTIAEVGGGTPPFLHFEVRRGFDALDPVPFFN